MSRLIFKSTNQGMDPYKNLKTNKEANTIRIMNIYDSIASPTDNCIYAYSKRKQLLSMNTKQLLATPLYGQRFVKV